MPCSVLTCPLKNRSARWGGGGYGRREGRCRGSETGWFFCYSMGILEGVVHMWKVSRSTHRKLITILALLSVLGLTATTAFAATPHFQPNITFKIGSLIADGELAGLDQQKVTVTLNATGIATVVCVHD